MTVTVRGNDLALGLWGPLAKTVWTGSYGRLGVSDRTTKTETLAWTNKSNRAVVFYAHVQLSRKVGILGTPITRSGFASRSNAPGPTQSVASHSARELLR